MDNRSKTIQEKVNDLFGRARMGTLCEEEEEQVTHSILDMAMRYAEGVGLEEEIALKYACVCLHRQNVKLKHARMMEELAKPQVISVNTRDTDK